jgi:hypothetical protein
MSYIFAFFPCAFTPPNRPGALLRPSLALPDPFCGLIFLLFPAAWSNLHYCRKGLRGVAVKASLVEFVHVDSVDDISPEREVEDVMVELHALVDELTCFER